MPLRLKRWIYRINQHEIVLECGYTLWGWAQARLIVDGEMKAQTSGFRFLPMAMDARIETTQPVMPLRAVITPGVASVHNELWAYGVPAASPQRASKGWLQTARGVWPEASAAQHQQTERV